MNQSIKYEVNPALRRLRMLDGKMLATAALSGAEYHFNRLKEIIDNVEDRWWQSPDFDNGEIVSANEANEILWHVRGLFWELVGVFDLIMQWTNDFFGLGIAEHEIRWNEKYKSSLKKKGDHRCDRMLEILSEARDSSWYFDVGTYRNFAHRSFLPFTSLTPKQPGRILFILETARNNTQLLDVREGLAIYINEMRHLCGKVFSVVGGGVDP